MLMSIVRRIIAIAGCVCGLLGLTGVSAQTVQISSSYTDTLLCLESNFSVPLTISNGQFAETNIFRIEISNATGSFANPVIVGYAYGKGDPMSGPTIALCTLPSSIVAGTGYRIRVIASSPGYTSGANNNNIRVSARPTVTMSPVSPICIGDAVTLSASTTSPNPSMTWKIPASSQPSAGASITINNTTYNDSGWYFVTVTSYNCSSKDSARVVIIPAPQITSVTSNSAVCEDAELTVNYSCPVCASISGSGLVETWTKPDNSTTNQSAITFFKSKLSDSGFYRIRVSIGNCWDTMSTYVKIKPIPDTPAATNNGPLCVGETLQLNASSQQSGITYTWTGPNGFISDLQSPTIGSITKNDEGDFFAYAVLNGCLSKPRKTAVKVGIPLVALPVSGDTTLCPGERLQLSAQTSITTGIEWKKYPNDSVAVAITRTFGKSSVTAEDSGLYIVTQEVQGCKSPPTYVHVNIPNLKAADAKNNGPLCIGETLQLSNTTTVNGIYSWTGPSGFTSNAQNPELANIAETAAGVYTVVTTLDFCSNTDSTVLSVKPMPKITAASSNSPVCTNTFLNLFAESNLGNATFKWTGPNNYTSAEQNPAIFYLDNIGGTYYVSATADGCESETDSINVISRDGPGLSTAKSNSPLNEGETLELYSSNVRDSAVILWTGPEGFTSSEPNPVIPVATYRNAGKYELTSVYNGCTTTTFTVVAVKDILGITLELYPNPNDGRFTITGITQTDAILHMTIFNHQGMIVHKEDVTPDKSKFKSEVDLRGAYSGVYILQLISGAEKRTVRFTIVRQ